MNCTIGKMLDAKAETNNNKVFLYFKDQQITYEEINTQANRYANGLLDIGIKNGDKVGIMMTNSPDFLYVFFGLAKIGAIAVPINTAYRGQILQYQLSQSDQAALVLEDIFLERIAPFISGLEKLKNLIVKRVAAVDLQVPGISLTPLEKVFSSRKESPGVEVKQSDPLSIIYTSGTTGPSKGALMPHQYLILTARDNFSHRGGLRDDIFYTCLPLFHGNALGLTIMTAIMGDASVALGERFSPGNFWDEIRSYRATQFNYLGAMIAMLMKQEERPGDADNPVRIALGAAAPPNLIAPFEKRFNIRLMEGYGLTESGVVSTMTCDDIKHGSIGKPRENYDLKIVDDDDNEVPPGAVGEIISRPQRPFSMMTGYYNMPEKTLEVFRNLWFHTGDYGYRGEDGYYYFVDRKKDAIRRRGENISSFEVEKVINTHPSVMESAAVAVKSEMGEDEVKVVVVLKPAQTLKYEDLMAYCEQNMAYFMVPRYVEYVDVLPKTQTERVEKHKLRDRGVTETTWDREKAGYRLKR